MFFYTWLNRSPRPTDQISAAGHNNRHANVPGVSINRGEWSENNRGTKTSRDHRQPRLLGRADVLYSRATPRPLQGTGSSYSKHATVHASAGNRSIVVASHTSPSLAASRPGAGAPPPTHIIVVLFFLFLVVVPAGYLSLERLPAAQTIPLPRHSTPASACELSWVSYRVCSTLCDAVFISNRPFTRRRIALLRRLATVALGL